MLRFTQATMHNTWSDASHVVLCFIYSDAIYFHSLRKKTSERVDAAGDRCMAITVIQYFIVIER